VTAIDEIKARIDIAELLAPYVALRKSGRGLTGCCPFHEDRSPSFVVYPESWSYHCFGCGAHGDGFTFLMKKEGLSFREALARLAERAGVPLEASVRERAEAQRRSRLARLIETAAAYYRECLRGELGAAARQYLTERGIRPATSDAFGLGYAPAGWENGLRYLTGLGFSREEVIAAGLAVPRPDGSAYDRFRHRLIVPIRDREGKPIAFGGRALAAEDQPKYLNSPETALFQKGAVLFALDRASRAIQQEDRVVIVEGYFDAISAHQAGYTNVVAQLGTALTERQLRLLTRLTRRIVLAFDADRAGREATLRSLAVAQAAAQEVQPVVDWQGYVRFLGQSTLDLRVLSLPTGKDPDELLRQQPEAWPALVEAAQPVLDYLFAQVLTDLDLNDPVAKTRAADLLLPTIQQIGDPLLRASYLQRLAWALRVEEKTLLARLPAGGTRPGARRPGGVLPAPAPADPPPPALAPGRQQERYALAVLLHFPSIDPATVGLVPELFEGPAERALLTALPGGDEALASLRQELATLPLPELDEVTAVRALQDVAQKLRDRYHRRRILGGAAAAEAPDQLAPAGDEAGRLLAVWKARQRKGDRL
jgi:DNA primase